MLIAGILPIVWLFVSLCVLRLPGHVACPCGLALAAALALSVMGAAPGEVASAAFEGLLFALWPILLAIIAAMVLYRYSVETGGMDRIKGLLTGISRDKRILVLILAWGFGGFLEGVAGFGVPVLIPGCILVALGFSPMLSVVACLVANSAPTPYATIGIPVTTLSGVTGIDAGVLGSNVAIQLFVPCLILPFFLVMLVGGGVRAVKGVGLITLVAGLSFALPLLLVSRFMGPELPTLIGSVCAIACITAASKRFYKDDAHNRRYQIDCAIPAAGALPAGGHGRAVAGGSAAEAVSAGAGLQASGVIGKGAEAIGKGSEAINKAPEASGIINKGAEASGKAPVSALQACLPFGIVLLLVTATSLVAPLHEALNRVRLDAAVYAGAGGHTLTFAFLLTPGILILVSTVAACFLQGGHLSVLARIARDTVLESRNMFITIITIIAMAKVMDYSGMTDAIAIMLIAVFAAFYPLVAPVIGMLGTFITGSDTTCCILFGGLQASAAQSIGADPAWIASSNLSAAAAGKMISPQSVAVGLRIGGLDGREGEIIRQTLKYALACTAIISLTTFGRTLLLGY